MPEYECGTAFCYQNEDVRRRPTVCQLKFVDKAFKRMLASGLWQLIAKKKKIVFYVSGNLRLPISKIIFLCIKVTIS